ncbi:cupin domain-containing protein [Actinoplanes sp. KI2]|uniref:cupin domain-containing protein n=1 Tax=Actinoplanes sp. KI2 TaxID=2983315 RepID=UPI0021D6092B|nr:cupin domain-containing protein [Actinoplanes sp. KI2]MCU7726861.1 cupin domain-containing protein [Actinoplanes sp. KI2]
MERTRANRMILACVAAVLGLSLVGSAAEATPPGPGVTGTILWQKTVGGRDLVFREIHLPAGQATGWHFHDGNLYAVVRKGTLSHFDSTCNPDAVYRTGSFIFERAGAGHVHIGRNLGRTEVVLDVLYVLPHGAPLAEDAPNPGCPFQ